MENLCFILLTLVISIDFMVLDTKKIKNHALENFENAWLETIELLPKEGEIKLKNKGNAHPLQETIQKIRENLLQMGFDEIENKFITDESDVYKQYGPEAPLILDRCYYLATLPRPELGIGKKKEIQIRKIDPGFDENKKQILGKILRMYKIGSIEGDDFIEMLVKELNWKPQQATETVDRAFPELKTLKPVAGKLVLRSHMTAVWFETLSVLQYTQKHPIALFSIGARFRNEQKEDAGHLRTHYGASLVLMDKNMNQKTGNELVKKLLGKIGFKNVKFKKKNATSKYYAPKTEYEIFTEWEDNELEIGDVGMYSPVALARYDIGYPVFNAGFGIERIASILYGFEDIRKLVYPQFYNELKLTDEQIAEGIEINLVPLSKEGKILQKKMFEETKKYKDEKTPFKLSIKFKISEKEGEVEIFKDETGKKFLGPAGMNEIYVYNGNIIALDPAGKEFEGKNTIIEKGIATGITFLEAITNYAAHEIEKQILINEKSEIMIPIARGPNDVNITISKHVYRYIIENKKKIDIRGPIFFGVRVK